MRVRISVVVSSSRVVTAGCMSTSDELIVLSSSVMRDTRPLTLRARFLHQNIPSLVHCGCRIYLK